MLAYALVSKPCSEDTDIGYIFSGGSSVYSPRQIPIFVTLLLYILIPPVKKNNTSVMVLPQQKYYNKIIGNVVQKIAFKAH